MLHCRKDTAGVIELTLPSIGLFLASAILLTVVFSVVFSNDWHKKAELESLASDVSNLLLDLDTLFFESEHSFHFPEKPYVYRVFFSTEYIALSTQGLGGTSLFTTKRLLITIWPRLPTQNWTTRSDLHSYLNETYGHQGVLDDPLTSENFTRFLEGLTLTVPSFALQPFEILMRKPVVIEKVRVYYEPGMNHDFLLLYQGI